VNPLLDLLDNGIDARGAALAFSRIDRIPIARLQTVRALVWGRLHELGHEIASRNHQVTIANCGELSSTAVDNLQSLAATGSVFVSDAFVVLPEDWSKYIFEPIPVAAGRDPLVVNERNALRRLLRLLNKVITIALRCEASHNSLRQRVLRLRAFFVTHGNHPPRDLLSVI